MLLDSTATREIYLVFDDSDSYIGYRFIKEGFRHVFAIERQATGWICYDPSMHDLYCMAMPADYDVDIISQLSLDHPEFNIIQLFVKPINKKARPRFGLLSCVAVIQYVLGVTWPLVLTPYQLYSKLVNGNLADIEVGKIWAEDEQETKRRMQQSVLKKKQKHYRDNNERHQKKQHRKEKGHQDYSCALLEQEVE